MNDRAECKWLSQARHDLRMAELNLEIEGFDVACFLAQQAVEKLLKGLLIFERGEADRRHNLESLGMALGVGDDLLDAMSDLTVDYLVTRYPDMTDRAPHELYDRPTATQKLGIAKRVFDSLAGRAAKAEAGS